MICPNCGKKSKYRNPAFCESCGASFTQPVQQEVPVQQAVPELSKKKRRRVKWWMIVLPILIAALAAGGIFYARTQKQYTAEVYYDEDGDVTRITSYDEDGHFIGYRFPDDGTKGKLKETDVSREFDVSADKKTRGADRVVCRQWVYEWEDGESAHEGDVEVWVFDKDDHLILEHNYSQDWETKEWETSSITTYKYYGSGKMKESKTEYYEGGEVYATSEYKYNSHGHAISGKMVTADGVLVSETEYEQSYFLGIHTKMVITVTTYMERNYGGSEEPYEKLDEPYTTTNTRKFHYTFGLVTSADGVTETDDPNAEEDVTEYRIEFEYD